MPSGTQNFPPLFPSATGISALRNAHDLANASHTRHHIVRSSSSQVMMWSPPMAVTAVVHTVTLMSALRLLAASIALANAACAALLQRQQSAGSTTSACAAQAERLLRTTKTARQTRHAGPQLFMLRSSGDDLATALTEHIQHQRERAMNRRRERHFSPLEAWPSTWRLNCGSSRGNPYLVQTSSTLRTMAPSTPPSAVSYTPLRAPDSDSHLLSRLLLSTNP